MNHGEAADVVAAELARGAAAAIARVANRELVRSLIAAILADEALAGECAAASQRHPFGHDKLMLVNADPAFQLRLHAWWPNRTHGVEHVHHHRFALATHVLTGRYGMDVFERAGTGREMTEYRQYTDSSATDWHLDSLGPSRLRRVTSTWVTEGTGYALTADDLHRVAVPAGTLCVTLFLAVIGAAGLRTETQVFAEPGGVAPALSRSEAMPPDVYRRRLSGVAAVLAGAGT